MIEEAYVSFETACLLKEKGFNEKCFALYNPDGILVQSGIRLNNSQVDRVKGSYSAPTHQMAMRWLRKVHNLIISVELDDVEYVNIATGKTTDCDMIHEYYSYCIKTYEVSCNPKVQILRQRNSKAYEEACEVAIKYCLENLI